MKRLQCLLIALIPFLALGCGNKSGELPGEGGEKFKFSITEKMVTITQGQKAQLTIQVSKPEVMTKDITFSLDEKKSKGFSFVESNPTLKVKEKSIVVTLEAASDAKPGPGTLTIVGSDGSHQDTATTKLLVEKSKETLASEKTEFLQTVESSLGQSVAKLDQVAAIAGNPKVPFEQKMKLIERLQELYKQRKRVEDLKKKVVEAAPDAWENHKSDLEAALKELDRQVVAAQKEFEGAEKKKDS